MVETYLVHLKESLFYRLLQNGKGDFCMYDITQTGNRIRELRMKEGKTQEQVAAEAGICIRTYRVVEQGRRGCSIDTLLLLAEYFGVSLDFLIKGSKTGAAFDLEKLIFGLNGERREKMLRIIKNMIETLGWQE